MTAKKRFNNFYYVLIIGQTPFVSFDLLHKNPRIVRKITYFKRFSEDTFLLNR